MKPKIKKIGHKWMVFGWHGRRFLLCNTWAEAIEQALRLAYALRNGSLVTVANTGSRTSTVGSNLIDH